MDTLRNQKRRARVPQVVEPRRFGQASELQNLLEMAYRTTRLDRRAQASREHEPMVAPAITGLYSLVVLTDLISLEGLCEHFRTWEHAMTGVGFRVAVLKPTILALEGARDGQGLLRKIVRGPRPVAVSAFIIAWTCSGSSFWSLYVPTYGTMCNRTIAFVALAPAWSAMANHFLSHRSRNSATVYWSGAMLIPVAWSRCNALSLSATSLRVLP